MSISIGGDPDAPSSMGLHALKPLFLPRLGQRRLAQPRPAQPRPGVLAHNRLAQIFDGLDEATCASYSDEIDRILSGRIRHIALKGRLNDLCRETSWRQRSRVARGWLVWAMLLSLPMATLDWMFRTCLLEPSLILRGPFLLPLFGLLTWIWTRPRAEWMEGLTLPITVAGIMVTAGILGTLGGGQTLNQYLAAGVFSAATAIVIFPVSVTWTIVAITTVIAAYVGFGLSDPDAPVNGVAAFALFFTLVLAALVVSRRTMNILQQYSLLLNLRSILQAQALARANAKLAVLANTDGLTGLANRRAYEDEAARRWAEPADPPPILGIVLFDIDHFKKLNDAAGHAAGDLCLRTLAVEIKRIVADSGLCARYGGEEFICLVKDATPFSLLQVAEDLRAAVESLSWPNAGTGRPVTVSVGLAMAQADGRGESLAALVAAADAALYRAKDCGRNRVVAAWEVPPAAPACLSVFAEPLCA